MIQVSPEIASLVPYRPGQSLSQTRRELGLDSIVKLASNENPLGPSPAALAAMRNHLESLHLYPDAASFDLTQYLSQRSGLPMDQIALGNGSNELIDLLIRTFCVPREDKVLIADKSFVAYEVCAAAARVEVTKIPQMPGFQIDTEAVAAQALSNSHHKVLFLPNPNNPTGSYIPGDQVRDLLERLRGWPGLVVLDEAYVEYVRAPDYEQALPWVKRYPNLVVIHTFSKVYGLAGLRLGALYGPAEVVGYLHRVRNPFNVNTLAQVAGQAALGDQDYIRRSQEVVWQGLDFWEKSLSNSGIPFTSSQANFVLVDLGRPSGPVFQALLRRGVITRPVDNYGLPHHLRISMGLPEENQKAWSALQEVLGEVSR